ncbi:MAG: sulfotransferase family protein [Planctomycetota bacterium]|jgi:hypothetical protein
MSEGASQFVFIRGTGRCGSTMLLRQLGSHPRLVPIALDEILPEDLVDFGRRRPAAWCPEVDETVLAEATRHYVAAFFRALTGRDGIYVHKGTMRAHHLDTLLDYFPGAKLLYLVRHPLGVVESLINADLHLFKGRFGYRATVANSLLRWYNDIAAYLRSRACGAPGALQVHFEALVRRPDETLAAIHRFLGVEPAPWQDLTRPDRYDPRFVLNGTERRWILKTTTDVVERLGYDPAEWSDEVPAAHAKLKGEHPDRRLGAVPPALDGADLVRLALAEASKRGYDRVGLFGGGYLAHLVCPRLGDPPADVAGIFDDDPQLVGREIGGYMVHRPEDAPGLGVEAVVPLTLVHQAKLAERWRRLLGDRIPVLPLWHEQEPALTAARV